MKEYRIRIRQNLYNQDIGRKKNLEGAENPENTKRHSELTRLISG